MEAKRHTCIVCKRKRAQHKMNRFRSHWACDRCIDDPGIKIESPGNAQVIKILNLYAGIGGNRRNWKGLYHVTAVEFNPKVAAEYKRLYPEDDVIISCAHEYLLKNYFKFDIIWASPPCPTHSRMNYSFGDGRRRYVDMRLYQEILLLKKFFKGRFVIENVIPYYEALIPIDYIIGRHVFWSNFPINEKIDLPCFKDFIVSTDKQALMDWLGIHIEKNIYLTGKDKNQVLRNCCHPVIGQSILNDAILYNKKQ